MKFSRLSVILVALSIAFGLAATRSAHAQTETVLYNFCSATTNCTDGAVPVGGVIADTAGNLYGATFYGGKSSTGFAGGAVFKVTPAGEESVLYSLHNGFLDNNDGYWPYGTLTMDAQGNLYGTTERGGANSLHVVHGDGIAFKVSQDGTETILHNFGAFKTDGVEPLGGMVIDAKGNLYGTTDIGGVYTAGTLFRLSPGGVETVLHNFADTDTDGGYPLGSLIMDKSGNLYGTTVGRSSTGTVFELTADGSYQILHKFARHPDGSAPLAGLTLDSQGDLYGTTYQGGTAAYPYGGTVFKLTPHANGSWQETIFYNFTQQSNSCQNPQGNVVFDAQGNLYGTTSYGGTWSLGCVYKLSPAGEFTVLHEFGEGTDGASPTGNLLFSQGNLYGTTSAGGANSEGTVFKVTP